MSPTPQPAYDKQVHHWCLSSDILGRGTTSLVVRATHAKLPTLCAAVKVISRSGLLARANADPTALPLVDAVIHREVLLMKLAQHPRVVRLYDFVGGCGDLVYIIMEHAPQKTLLDLFRAAPAALPHALVSHVFAQLAQGLAHAHALHIVHRDLKLENIFLFGPGDIPSLLRAAHATVTVKIGDFGLAHIDDPPGALSAVFHGSPHYQAPEVWRRAPHRARPTDVWSAGVVLYALLCRRLPFTAAALQCAPAGPHLRYAAAAQLPPAADRLLRRIFAHDPAARPTARDMLSDGFVAGLAPAPPHDVCAGAPAVHPRVALYDLAMLAVPPRRYVPRETFAGSALARAVQARLADPACGGPERQWAQCLSAHEARREAWEAAVEVQAAAFWRAGSAVAAERPTLMGALSFHSLRARAAARKKKKKTASAHAALAGPSAAPPVAGALQDRREALLRRAYELGFGTGDLRAFADETGVIVRVAREGGGCMGVADVAREVARRRVGSCGDGAEDAGTGRDVPAVVPCN